MKRNQIIHGDSLEYMRTLPDKCIDLVLTDPPYGTTALEWDNVVPFNEMWKELNRVCKSDSAMVIFGLEPFSSALRMSNINNYKYDWIWEKQKAANFLNLKHGPGKYHENIMIFSKETHRYFPKMEQAPKHLIDKRKTFNQSEGGTHYGGIQTGHNKPDDGLRYPRSILKFDKKMHNYHPTEKPENLFRYLIETYSQPGDLVLDCFAGSFTTAVACIETGRDYICIEKEAEYVEIGKKRVKNTTPPLFVI